MPSPRRILARPCNDVRSPEAYHALARRVFGDVTVDVRHSLMTVPYSHAIITCRKTDAA